ncbi:putative pre-mRNA-splicing factor ATP-dependent RNA helicase DEAH6 [Astathelohania contejeani]|uniref:Pre-mRNA-splicing factor ATP-dependent RNA helicase DEAH6 n=1 Tax=Astathelohania contejeani TaxID=164912 RepID=A0ABQ7I2W3_9MICR|nr:putative pre-mRNA-splicing factor ATP-dependent RNA helicase DEAH6 [Thelohania contejeani]
MIQKFKDDILEAIKSNKYLIITGGTGTGKSTQIPIFLHTLGKVLITQPRRVSAIALASRVSKLIGKFIAGYKVRFKSKHRENTQIIYTTEGMLLNMLNHDPFLSDYQFIILDEFHERTINMDLLLGIIKELVKKRKNLRLIVMSATGDIEKLSDYLDYCPVYNIPGRTYQIRNFYDKKINKSVCKRVIETIEYIIKKYKTGDILVFLSGLDEIEECWSNINNCDVLPLRLHSTICDPLVFTECNQRKVIFATNIAETSLTIKSIGFVIDTGKVKVKYYDHNLDSEYLEINWCSKDSCKQRAGRSGRTQDGYCYRLFTKEQYNEMEQNIVPEILRSDLSGMILKILKFEIEIDFIDKPNKMIVNSGMKKLEELGLVSDGNINDAGRFVSELPLDPMLGKMVYEGMRHGVTDKMVVLVSMICAEIDLSKVNKKKKNDFENLIEYFYESKKHKKKDSQLLLANMIYLQISKITKKYSFFKEQKDICNVIKESLILNLCRKNGNIYNKLKGDSVIPLHKNPFSVVDDDDEFLVFYQLKGKEKTMIYLMGVTHSNCL